MNGLDLLLIVLAVVAAFGGWQMGFLRRLSGWIGAAAGLTLAVLTAPEVLKRLSLNSDVAVFMVGAAYMILFASLAQSLGAMIGSKLRRTVGSDGGRRFDSFSGSLLGIVGVAVLAWLVIPVMAGTTGSLSASARGSAIAHAITNRLPRPPSQITDIERKLAGGQFPRMFAGIREAPQIPSPPRDSSVTRETLASAARSSVRVEAPACSGLQSGSGFMVQPNLVVTNAHVVAGAESVSLTTADGERAKATVIHFDPRRDLALLATSLDRPPLGLSEPEASDSGLVLGFPRGGPFDPSPFLVGQRLNAKGYDIYDKAYVDRDLLVLASELEPGDSGSAVLKDDGTVIGIAVAIAPDEDGVAYALSSTELAGVLQAADSSRASTGACIR